MMQHLGYIYFLKSKSKREVPFTVGDLTDGLCHLEPVHRRAVLFGLEQGLSIDAVVEMTWGSVRQMKLTELAQDLVNTQPRHIRLPYLFWTEDSKFGLATPLIGLKDLFNAAFLGWTWDALLKKYPSMIWIDYELEAKMFREAMKEEGLL